jgi:hypothetical protein
MRCCSMQPPVQDSSSLAHGFFYPEDGGDTFLRNVGSHKIYTKSLPEDGILYSHRRGNLKSYKYTFFYYSLIGYNVS